MPEQDVADDESEQASGNGRPRGGDGAQQPAAEDDRSVLPVDREQPPRLPFTVVGMGASAGGVEALTEFFDAMPSNTGMAFVVVQHLPPERDSMMSEILSRHTRMPVREVQDGLVVQRNHVYVIRPGNTLTIRFGKLHLGEPVEKRGHQRPVDDFFRSLAEEQRERAVCVLLSGMGSNGTAGAQMVKAVGGLCVAQDPETAKFPSMPRALIDAGLSDYVLRPSDMPETLARYAAHPYAKGGKSADARGDKKSLAEILALLRTRARHDFSGYKRPTVIRRVQRRMGLNQVSLLADYAKLLRTTPSEAVALADDLLIHVTGFFRDPEAWDALREKAIVPLVQSRPDDGSIRCWITACSSGEEAYSMAILLVEAAEAAAKHFDIKVFATDMAERSLAHARAGIYPGGIESDVSPERLARFFDRDESVYRVRRELRELIVFAPQNVLQDPPFSRMDICSCRNLLIYLEPEMQRKVLAVLHFGLTEGGTLFLGTSETNAGAEELFEAVDKKARLFRRVGPTRHGAIEFRTPQSLTLGPGQGLAEPERAPGTIGRVSLAQLTQRTLLERYTPASVVVDRDLRIVYYHGRTEPFLDQPRGEPTRDLMALARQAVRGPIRAVLNAAVDRHEAGSARDGTIQTDDGPRQVTVRAVTLQPSPNCNYFLVSFDLSTVAAAAPSSPVEPGGEVRLHEELARVRDDLQATVEALQATNEEMRASNEEVTSVNEELQSTNEELETSKEEMQSLNEELTTVNAQLHAKMEELQAATNDLTSLLSSTDIAVIFLDTQFRVRRFTPAVGVLIDLISADVGRPLRDLSRKFDDPDLLVDADAVLARLVPVEREVRSAAGRTYVRRVLPYRTTDNRIDGVVITFVDITARKVAEDALRANEERLRRVLAVDTVGIVFFDADGRISDANDAFLRLCGYDRSHVTAGRLTWARLTPAGTAEPMDHGVAELRETGRLAAREAEFARPDGSRWWGLFAGARLEDGTLVNFVVDVTERRRAVADLAESEARFRALADVVPGLLWRTDAAGHTDWFNQQWVTYTGQTLGQARGRGWFEVIHPDDRDRSRAAYDAAIRSGQPLRLEHRIRRADGGYRWFRIDARPSHDAAGRVVEWFGVATDIHDERAAVESLRESAERTQLAAGAAGIGFWAWDVVTNTDRGDAQHNRIMGLPPEASGGPLSTFLDRVHADDRDRVVLTLTRATEQPVDFAIRFRVVHEGGEVRWVIKHGRPVFEGQPRAVRVIGTLLDVTDRVRAEQERERLIEQEQGARRAAEAANDAKDQFLANVSHELRTPLSAIMLWSKMLRAKPDAGGDPHLAEGLDSIARAAESQRELIEDLLDTSRIVSGKLRLDTRRVAFAPLVHEAIDQVRPAAEAKRVTIGVAVADGVDVVDADPDRLRQVMWNLLSNAVKFTPADGRVDVAVRQDVEWLEVTVSDTGRGIAADQLPHVFERFWQAESAARQTQGGLGLGLAIAKQLAELHGGTIDAESEGPGRGSTFRIRLPLPVADRPAKAPNRRGEGPTSLSGVRILLVEDDVPTRDALVMVLKAAGATVTPVGTSADALAAFEAAHPDLILSDLGLPDGDGNDLIRRIRTLEADRKAPVTPAVALTALVRRQDRRRTAESGFQQHVAKPVDPERLVRTLWALLET